MATDDESSDLSSLSSLSPALSDIELERRDAPPSAKPKAGLHKFFRTLSDQPPREPSPPTRKRSPSPAHVYILADNPDIALIVMFRSRFHDAFPKSLSHFGPQELEHDIVEPQPGHRVEHFLCALLGLLLNRKQDVKQGHYGRALEDAIASHKAQWPLTWDNKSPLSGNATFSSMTPVQRLTLLRTLIIWALASSEILKGLITQSYKQNRHEDDLNQPRSVQPWGSDGEKRRYFLIEGLDDTHFRVYRESNPAGTNRTWWSVAGSIAELKALAERLETRDGGPKARRLSQKILQAIPRFEAGEEKRKRREYRQMRKEQFRRPEPGFSLYEGRTRGKRMKYTYSDEEDTSYSDVNEPRLSARNTGASTPAEAGQFTTSSGRQVRPPPRLDTGVDDSAPGSVQSDSFSFDQRKFEAPSGRPRRNATKGRASNGSKGFASRYSTFIESDDDEEPEADFGDDEDDADAHVSDESEDEDEFDDVEAMVDDDLDEAPPSMLVKLVLTPPKLRTVLGTNSQAASLVSATMFQKKTAHGSAAGDSVTDPHDASTQGSIHVADGGSPNAQSPYTEDREAHEERAAAPPSHQTQKLEVHFLPTRSEIKIAPRPSPDRSHASHQQSASFVPRCE